MGAQKCMYKILGGTKFACWHVWSKLGEKWNYSILIKLEVYYETLADRIATIGIALPVSYHMDTLSYINTGAYNHRFGSATNGDFVYRCTDMWSCFAVNTVAGDARNARIRYIHHEHGLGRFHTIPTTWINFSVRVHAFKTTGKKIKTKFFLKRHGFGEYYVVGRTRDRLEGLCFAIGCCWTFNDISYHWRSDNYHSDCKMGAWNAVAVGSSTWVRYSFHETIDPHHINFYVLQFSNHGRFTECRRWHCTLAENWKTWSLQGYTHHHNCSDDL